MDEGDCATAPVLCPARKGSQRAGSTSGPCLQPSGRVYCVLLRGSRAGGVFVSAWGYLLANVVWGMGGGRAAGRGSISSLHAGRRRERRRGFTRSLAEVVRLGSPPFRRTSRRVLLDARGRSFAARMWRPGSRCSVVRVSGGDAFFSLFLDGVGIRSPAVSRVRMPAER